MMRNPKELLSRWLSRARKKRKIHIAAARYYARLHSFMTLSVIFLSTATGGVGFGVGYAADYVGMVISACNLLVGAVSAAQYFCRYDEKSAEHQETSEAFSNLTRSIETTMHLNKIEQPQLDKLLQEFNSIISHSPMLPMNVIDDKPGLEMV